MEEQLADAVNCLFLAIKEERNDIVRAVLENAGQSASPYLRKDLELYTSLFLI